ncbi:DeoR/GlpR family DNA-binding transcription regulator [Fusibacter sp. 3D3]|uniref:DeoR/GlpR family DNA-binding transcription regulator n=1 Tax=Fusibacter sp. 3D3 TaxID=1048380 RepID=UPI000852F031|nr:DeoR/GlpR family DNA-binding transcription regulator [Fusibacter sp. 3D3]GAU76615.1 transcriptional repressor of the fructose operon, DeoR family [Fusibacter sp. 3D3]
MFLQERHHKILELLQTQKRIIVTDLSKQLHVSVDTIRRDLTQLEAQNLLIRTFGGAILPNSLNTCPSFEIRKELHKVDKEYIGKLAFNQIKENDTVFIDGSTTSLSLLPYLEHMKKLTIVTNSIEVISSALEINEGLNLYMIGGTILNSISSTIGNEALLKLSELRVDKAFISTSGFNAEGLFGNDFNEVAFKKMLIKNSSLVYFLLDSSKYNKSGSILLSKYDGSFKIICDSKLSSAHKSELERICQGILIY